MSVKPGFAALAAAGLVAVLGLGAAAVAQAQQDDGAATEPPPAGGQPLAVLDSGAQPPVDPAALAASLDDLLEDPALGPQPGAVVLDTATGRRLLESRADEAVAPASSLKIVTAVAVLTSLGPQHRLPTSVVSAADGELVLVGGGDPTLLTVAPQNPAGTAPAATLAELADRTAQQLRSSGTASVTLKYDAGLFSGPELLTDWDPTFVGLGIVSPVSALTADPSSQQIDRAGLDRDPAETVASWFAARLSGLGIAVEFTGPGSAPPGARVVASVESPAIAALADRMLDVSDNDIAEALFRLAAVGLGLPGSFEGGRQAVGDVLERLQIATPGLVLRDGSGLSRDNRIAPITLAEALRLASEPTALPPGDPGADDGAGAGGITWAPTGLPVGGLTGSLSNRFAGGETVAGAGRVRAKTGTLTGVTSLSGLVATEQGRPLAFVVLGTDTPDTLAARRALDRIAAQLAACGCEAGPS